MSRAVPSPAELLSGLTALAEEAGRAVLDVYGSAEIGLTTKDDLSPLTLADRRSHQIITKGLAALAHGTPVISEEGNDIPYEERKGWQRFFLVDPLDGTKEFISRNGEFTVNIAMIEGGEPVIGVVHVPVLGVTYFAAKGKGAFKKDGAMPPTGIHVGAPYPLGLTVVVSRSHGSEALEKFLGGLRVKDRISRGSSLKFCLVAEGAADLYPRFGPTWEWDTAAGHAVVLEAGGLVTDTAGDGPLIYNKRAIKHEGFIAWGTVRPDILGAYMVS